MLSYHILMQHSIISYSSYLYEKFMLDSIICVSCMGLIHVFRRYVYICIQIVCSIQNAQHWGWRRELWEAVEVWWLYFFITFCWRLFSKVRNVTTSKTIMRFFLSIGLTILLKNSCNIQGRQVYRKCLVLGSINYFSPLLSFFFCSRNLLVLPKFKTYIFFDSTFPLLRISPTKMYFKNVHCKIHNSEIGK